MSKRVILAGLLLGLVAAAAWAAGAGGKVVAVQKAKVRIVTAAAPEAWMKKGCAVKILGGKGVIVDVKTDSLWISTPKAATLKAGDAVTFEKARSTAAGC